MGRELTPEDIEALAGSLRRLGVRRQTRAVLAMGLKYDDMSFQLVVQVRDASPFDLQKIDDFRAEANDRWGDRWGDVFSIEFLIEHVEEAEVSADRGIDWFYVQWPHITYLDEPEDNTTAT